MNELASGDETNTDLAIIGAGPAGVSAARLARRLGLQFMLIDEQTKVGGNVYRNCLANLDGSGKIAEILGSDYRKGRHQMAIESLSEDNYLPGSQIFSLSRTGTIALKRSGQIQLINARKVLIATGAVERPTPCPGWELPGVMSVGAAQTLLKDAHAIANGPIVFAGSGPLLFLTVIQYLRMGIVPAALLLTGPYFGRQSWLGALRALTSHPSRIGKGIRWIIRTALSKIKVYTEVEDLRIKGHERVGSVSFRSRNRSVELPAEHVFLHEGVVPNTALSMAADCQHVWNAEQVYWAPVINDSGRTSQLDIYVAGDSARILGADAAPLSAQLAVLSIATDLAVLTRADMIQQSKPLLKDLRGEVRIREFIDRTYPPPVRTMEQLPDETMVCRCEQVLARDIRALADVQCTTLGQAKAFTRCGMGPCQGRMCGLTVATILAHATGCDIESVGYYRMRAPIRPVSVAELATMNSQENFSILGLQK